MASKSKIARGQRSQKANRPTDSDATEATLRRRLAIEPRDASANHELALALRRQRAPIQFVLEHFRQAWVHAPENPDYTRDFFDALIAGGFRAKAAVVAKHAALAANKQGPLTPPATFAAAALASVAEDDLAQEHIRFAQRFVDAAQDEAAIVHLRAALQFRPSSKAAFARLYLLYRDHGLLVEAASLCSDILTHHPNFVNGHIWLGSTLTVLGRHAEAAAHYRLAIANEPDNTIARSALLFDSNYVQETSAKSRFDDAVAFGDTVVRNAQGQVKPAIRNVSPADHAKLRVGLVSGDLREHPVAQFLLSVLAQTAGGVIDWYVYATVNFEDTTTHKLRRHAKLWRSIYASNDEEACTLIEQDGIEVLIDLSGHTAGSRLGVFARRPAAVQISWLGYFATTGLPMMDYLLADRVGLPPDEQKFFTEKVVYLPDTRLCFTAPENSPAVAPPPMLACDQFTFGTFQNAGKITDQVLGLWAQILDSMANSRLRLQSVAWGSERTKNDMVDRMQRASIDQARISFFGADDRAGYLARYAEVDMIIDTFPYPGGTTTCEALWMGVPTVTLKGDSLLARQGASILTAAGLPDWIATSTTEYVSIALAFAQDPGGLTELRKTLRERVKGSALMDARRFFQALEATLHGLARKR